MCITETCSSLTLSRLASCTSSSQWHNKVHNITADLKEVCNDITVEPVLRPLSRKCFEKHTANIDDCARADISARGVWRHGERALFDIRFFLPKHRIQRREHTVKEFEKWNMAPSLLSCSPQLEALVLRQQPSTNDLPVY